MTKQHAEIGRPAAASGPGALAALSAYTAWGLQPVLFRALDHVPTLLVVAHRTIWALLLVTVMLVMRGRIADIRAALADGRTLRTMTVSSLLLGGSWMIYVYAVASGNALEASFGYFINPLMNIALGTLLLGERQNRWQVVSIGIALVAIAIQAVSIGGVPYIALSLSLSFALYGYIRKTARVGAAPGLFVESLVLAPFALVYLVYVLATEGVGVQGDPATLALLASTGPVTALPLMLFAYAVQRLRLTTIGMFQYVSPTLMFLLAVLSFGEPIDATRLLSFVLIWISLAVFTLDALRQRRRSHRAMGGV